MKKTAFYTLGCKVNQYETEQMREKFIKKGYKICDFDGAADVYVINTCSVTAVADKKSRQTVMHARRNNPNAVVVVTGCWAQSDPQGAAKLPGVDIVLGNSEKADIVEQVEKFASEKIVNVSDIMQQKQFLKSDITSNGEKTRAFMKIQDGCDNYCSYCIIPYVRGHRRSRSLDDIVREAERFAQNGYREIVLTGIHLTSYGTETGSFDLTDVLTALHKIDGINRIRLGSLELTDVLYKVADMSGSFPKLCPQFHISLQSGSETVLKRMRRRYTPKQYLDAAKLLQSRFKNAAVTTDIIVGFPGETDEEFKCSEEFAKKVGFAKIHIFPYSRRPGTPAADMENQVPENIKKARAHVLQKTADEIRQSYFNSCMGKTFSLLAEQRTENGMYIGHCENYMPAQVFSKTDIRRQIVNVKITNFSGDTLLGTVAE